MVVARSKLSANSMRCIPGPPRPGQGGGNPYVAGSTAEQVNAQTRVPGCGVDKSSPDLLPLSWLGALA
jgi:hypothetical protein